MYKNRQNKIILVILLMVTASLSYKLFNIINKSAKIKNQGMLSNISEKSNYVKIYGYSDILQLLTKSNVFKIKSINVSDNQKCSIEVIYNGDIKLLYSSLCSLIENENFLGISGININNDEKITSIWMDFIKNK